MIFAEILNVSRNHNILTLTMKPMETIHILVSGLIFAYVAVNHDFQSKGNIVAEVSDIQTHEDSSYLSSLLIVNNKCLLLFW